MRRSGMPLPVHCAVALFGLVLSACGGGAGPTYAISGSVSGAVAPGVTVALSGASTTTTTTGPSGTYSFSGVGNGAYTVTPSLAGYTFSPATQTVTVAGSNVAGQDFVAMVAVPPSVIAVTPADGAATVGLDSSLALVFSKPVNVATGAITLTGPSGVVPIRVSVAGTTVTVKPSARLGVDTRYTLSSTAVVTDADGTPGRTFTSSFSTGPSTAPVVLGSLISDSFNRWRWGGTEWNVIPMLRENGQQVMRAWVTIHSAPELRTKPPSEWRTIPWRDVSWSSWEVTGAILREAADAGFPLQVVLFFGDSSMHAGRQDRPVEWVGLTEEDVAVRIEAVARDTALYFQSLGLDIGTFEIGNETDFGFCGIELVKTVPVPPGTDPVNNPAWMRANIWTKVAPLFKAGIRGLHSVYPSARIALHVAGFGYSVDDIAARAFFDSMIALAVPFDIAALSYPYMHAGQAVPQPYFRQPSFVAAIDYLRSLGKAVQIVEFDHPAEPAGQIHPAPPGYPFTEIGQRDLIVDLVNSLRGRVEAVHYWYPDWYPGSEPANPELESCGLFRDPATPREGLKAFRTLVGP